MFSSVHLHPTSNGARFAFRRRTSCGFCLCFQGGNREFDKTICWCDRRRKAFGNDYNPSQQLWLDGGENRSHSLCTISVNVDCRDEFVVCYGVHRGVHAMSRELNFLTCGLEASGSQTVSIVYGIIDGKSRALFPAKRGSYYLVNNSVRSRNHTISVTLNLGAVGIIWPACKPKALLMSVESMHIISFLSMASFQSATRRIRVVSHLCPFLLAPFDCTG